MITITVNIINDTLWIKHHIAGIMQVVNMLCLQSDCKHSHDFNCYTIIYRMQEHT
jgi:hypothetical protein